MGALAVIIVIALIIALILVIPVRVNLRFYFENNEFKKRFEIYYGFIKIKTGGEKKTKKGKASKNAKPDKPKKNKRDTMSYIRFLRASSAELKKLIESLARYLTKHLIKIDSLEISARLGTDDAMQTALIYGVSSAFLYNTIGGLERCVRLRGLSVDYKPVFEGPDIFIDIKSIIKTRIYNLGVFAVIALLRALPLIRKRGDFKNGKSD